MKKKGDFLKRILRISKEASDKKIREREDRIRISVDAGYNRMLEAIEKQAKNGCYWASINLNSDYGMDVADGIVKKLIEEGFDAKVRDYHILNTIVEASWSFLPKDEKKQC